MEDVMLTAARKKSEPNRFTFSSFALRNLLKQIKKSPPQKQTYYWDISTPGFGLRTNLSGTGTWSCLLRVSRDGGKRLGFFKLGRTDTMTLADARTAMNELKERIEHGEDPKQTAEKAHAQALMRSQDTFRVVADLFLQLHHPKKKKVLKPSTLRRYTGLLHSKDFASLQEMPVSMIKREDVIAVLNQIRTRGRDVSANRALAVLRKMFRWCIQNGYLTTTPTADLIPPAAEEPRTRHLYGNKDRKRPSEIALAWRAFEAIGDMKALPQLLLLTGQRLSEVAGMTDGELIDLDGPEPHWFIPGSRTKNGTDHFVPLTPWAVKVIRSKTRIAGSEFIFSTIRTTRITKNYQTRTPRPFSGFSDLKQKIDEAITALKTAEPARYKGQMSEPWRLHDLRRTFKTGLAELGIAPDIRDALANHSLQGVDAHYIHATHGPAKRAALLKWETHIQKLIKNK
jgi:integrase